MSKYRNRIYTHYVETWDETNVPTAVHDLENRGPTMRYVIDAFFPEDKSAAILDLGCGHGTLVHFAQQAGYRNAQGVDASKQQVELARKLGITNVVQGDLMETLKAIPSESLDTVIAFDVIEHFTKDELIDLVDAIHAVLKPTGCWIIHAPNAQSPFFGVVRYGDFTHEQAFTPSSIQQLLKASGYRKVNFADCGPRVHGIKSAVRFIMWKCIRIIYRLILIAESGDLKKGEIVTQNFYAVAYK
ncbi:class I SAM-dependent DNA methyltransferase [Shewanella sp.]|uniref:class I SAM-dependent DNA methyltransferase n=1 Tax=Shewanella sp. TaxID=50422 RepID=UPI0040474369